MSTLLSIPGSLIPQAHTLLAGLAFSVAIFMGWAGGLWTELCKNSVSKWPVEWFPSVSATIGDFATPRAPFHIIIALCATPRFLLLTLQWLVHRYSTTAAPIGLGQGAEKDGSSVAVKSTNARNRASATAAKVADAAMAPLEALADEEELASGSNTADVEFLVGIARTFTAGGWIYITSRDHHDLHDLFMIMYLVLTLPWMFLTTQNSTTPSVRRRRQGFFAGFLLTIPPLVWTYYRHSVQRIPGAYTHYAFFEWSLVFWDVAFDAVTMAELKHIRIAIIDTSRRSEKLEGNSTPHEIFLRPCAPLIQQTEVDWTAATDRTVVSGERRALCAWLSDVYLAVCFWTVFSSLGFQLFYWSVWKLALAGPELALLTNLSGYALSSRWIRNYTTSRNGLFAHRVTMVVAGMGCFFIPSPAARLIGISIGTWTGWLAQYGNWVRLKGSVEMVPEGQILGLGLAITLLLKYVNASTNPLWATTDAASGGWNITGLLLAAVCLYEYKDRPVDLFPAPPIAEAKDKSIPDVKTTRLQRSLITIGLGSMIHLIQTFVNDSGTIIAWTWTGYPIKGPTLHPFAGIVIAAGSLPLILTVDPTSPAWSLFGCAGAVVIYVFPDWIGFVGGLALVVYLSSTLPALTRSASALPPKKSFGHALLAKCILDVLSVVTAAYAFVPHGWLFRERTDLILGFCMASVVTASYASRQLALPGPSRLRPTSSRRTKDVKRWTVFGVGTLSVLGMASGYWMMPTWAPVPYHPDHRIFSGGIWAVHFGVDEPGRDSQRRMMELIRDMEVDIVGLLETDLHRFVYGNRDLTRIIAEELGYYVDLGPGPNKHTWGCVLLSKFPILNSIHHLLPSPHGELAPAIHATLDIHGQKINVWVSHNGQEEDALDRELQTIEIARNLRETADVPTVFLGYLVTHPGDQRPWPYQILMEDGLMYDIEIADRWRWCQYIAFRGMWRIGYARLHESDISDTELQVGKFMLPPPGEKAVYESNEEMYWHIGEQDIPEPWRMTRMFRGNGTRGHTYRIYDGPVYYYPPERSGMQEYGRVA